MWWESQEVPLFLLLLAVANELLQATRAKKTTRSSIAARLPTKVGAKTSGRGRSPKKVEKSCIWACCGLWAAMETLVRLNNQTAGRDKLARLLQYLARAVGAVAKGRAAHKLQGLEYALSTFRKLLRWGRCVEALHAALQALSLPDAQRRTTLALARVAHALFLFADHLLWLGRAGLAKVDAAKWTSIANRYWLYSVTLNLVRDVIEARSASEMGKGVEGAVVVDTVKNACDLFIPLTALRYTSLGPAAVGILGAVSSVAGILTLTHPHLKL